MNIQTFESLSATTYVNSDCRLYEENTYTVSQLQSMYTDYDLIHCIEQQDPTLQNWLINLSGVLPSQLMDVIKQYDGVNFVNEGLGCDITWAESILCGAGYDMNTFVQLMATDPDPALNAAVNDFWIRWNGTPAGVDDRLSLNELVMYGSKRLGVVNVDTTIVVTKYDGHTSGEEMKVDYLYSNTTLQFDTVYFHRKLGRKLYELVNQVGSVIVAISDRKMAVDSSGDSTIDYFTADVRNTVENYAYGGPLENRNYRFTETKFGYQGSLKDDEIRGKGKNISTLYREEDLDIPFWLSTDPIFTPSESPYSTMGNNPILRNDIYGDKTAYYDEHNHLLYKSNDKLKNAVTIISDKDLKAFKAKLEKIRAAKIGNTDKVNLMLRNYGVSYDFDPLDQLGKNSKPVKSAYLYDDKYRPLVIHTEAGTYLYRDASGKKVGVGKERFEGDEDTYWGSPQGNPNFKVGQAHTHPDAGRTGYIMKTEYGTTTLIPGDFTDHPSNWDIQGNRSTNGYYNVIVGPKNVRFWRNDGSMKEDIVVPRNIFKGK